MSTIIGIALVALALIVGVVWKNQDTDLPAAALSNDGRVNQVDSSDMTVVQEETIFEKKSSATDERVQFSKEEMELLKSSALRPLGDALVLIGQVKPPVVDGLTLQASSIHIEKDLNKKRIYIGYTMRGERFLGAVQILEVERRYLRLANLDIASGKLFDAQLAPKVVQTVVFRNFDINTVTEKNGVLYLGGGTGDESFKTPAVMEMIKLDKGLIPQKFTSTRVDLPSYTVTSIAVTDKNIYAATGDRDGGIIELPVSIPHNHGNAVYYQKLVYRLFEIDDVRDLTFDNRYVYAVKGTNAGLWLLDRSDTSRVDGKMINLRGATIPESKSTIELTRDSILMALGDGGVQLLDRESFKPRLQLNQKQHKANNALSVSNAATGHSKLLFIADGEAGARVLNYDKKTKQFNQTATISFGDGNSVNDIKYFNGYLIMATGMGGVKVARYYRSNPKDLLDEIQDSKGQAYIKAN